MNITGLDWLVFGVDDLKACTDYFTDYGLIPGEDGQFTALDGTGITLKPRDDASLPAPLETGNMLRKTIYGVADQQTLDAIAAELGKDREVKQLADGSIEAVDDLGFVLGFQISIRKALELPGESINSPGRVPQRPVNVTGSDPDASPIPNTLSHVVYFVPDIEKAEAFYTQRLGFYVSDRFQGVGPFMRPAGVEDHHTLFLLNTPPFMKGCEHFTFHMAGPTELLQAGTRFVDKGYESFWGPGRHIMGSNWFWYFNSPLGIHVEYDADMDLHDEHWTPRNIPMNKDTTQIFHFKRVPNWIPGPGD